MRKQYNKRWLKHHTVAVVGKGPWYSHDGIVAVIDGVDAGIIDYACDSYFDFEEGVETEYNKELKIHEYNWTWEGSAKELLYAASNDTDIMFPDRKLNETDSDYELMKELYKGIRKWMRKQKK